MMSAKEAPVSRARVVITEDAEATSAFVPQAAAVGRLFRSGLRHWTGKDSDRAAWLRLIKPSDVVGIKVHSAPGEIIGTRPLLVAAIVESLINAGFKPDQIVVWDKFRSHLRLAGFFELQQKYGVRVEGSSEFGWDESAHYENSLVGKPVWGDLEFGRSGGEIGRKSYYSRLVTREIKRHIVVVPLLNHNVAGVAGGLMSLALGSVDNSIRFETRPAAMAEAVPEIFGRPEIFDHLALVVVDALLCQYQGEENSRLHYSKSLNQLRFSNDPVALDVLSLHELEAQREAAGLPARIFPRDLYRNAELLQLGVADPRRLLVERAPFAAP
jgi:hypothetical protein